MKRTIKFVSIFLISFYFLSLTVSCAMPTISRFAVDEESREIEEIFRTSSTVSLAWNNDDPSNVQSFNMYYRTHGSEEWTFLDSTGTSAPRFEVSHESIGDGSWDFGVTAIGLSGSESEIHSSVDTTAVPDTGWYLLWIE